MTLSPAEKHANFRKLHAAGCFVLPNPWDVGSARYLAHCGFKALASTSAGYAWSTGRPDNKVTADDVIEHLVQLSAATDLPVNADFENGFADDPAGVAAHVARAAASGISGLSIENSTGRADAPLYDDMLAVERIKAARAAIDGVDPAIMLVARCEGYLHGERDLKKTTARLVAFAEAGADCLYAPGVASDEEITTLVKALGGKPLNVLTVQPTMTVQHLASLGVRRISVGGALARVAWAGFIGAAQEIAGQGTFTSFANGAKGGELNKLFGS
ncbi:isocitrate lyase/phosphoenolpyruvate mutase family protein [Tardiphaga alba]|uniref:Isocitrate lyase/phosphoenolpyruvate mutase family protein n=1 Tax=Tardiphaga alba TaxID=340268 RepID=A0ABX8AD06_9BRAD|nr:isocitrate lyase/phosphoenolpyruvate mutase family protein [Tardiphaga alba]QUS40856.1 isocitrate lyase/phosphoenolpyruvate mutase family protein [Tardiphaga alba]